MVTINLYLIFKILLNVSLAILFILFFITLIKLISVISKINSLLQKNKEQLETSIAQIPGLLKNSEKILENTNNNLKKINVLVENVNDILKASKKDILNTSGNVSLTLENIKDVSSSVAESSKSIASNFIDKSAGIKKNVNGFISIVNIALSYWDILKKIFKKKKNRRKLWE